MPGFIPFVAKSSNAATLINQQRRCSRIVKQANRLRPHKNKFARSQRELLISPPIKLRGHRSPIPGNPQLKTNMRPGGMNANYAR